MNQNPSHAPSIEKLAELLPQYGIESFIAHGGMGAVYKGRQLSLDREVAIKVLLNEFADNEEFKNAFTTEAKAMACLNHPNLLGVFDYGNIDGMPYIVMEYVRGGSLHEASWNKVIDPAQAVAITKGICNGLAHAHQHGIVHRDIKPANILLTMNAEPKVTDFGLAHVIDSGNTGLAMGTPGFTAPEVFDDASLAGPLAEVYSVGVIFHQLLTGIDPTGSMTPPTHPTGKIHLDTIWRKATHIVPSQRYTSIAEMVAALEKWSESKLVTVASTHAQNIYSPQRTVNTKASSGIWGKFLVMVLLLAALGFTLNLIQKKNPEEKPADSSLANHPDSTVESELESELETETKPEFIPDSDPIVEAPESESPRDFPKPEIIDREKDMSSFVPKVKKAKPKKSEKLPPGDLELRERAIGLIQKAHEKRIKDISDKTASDREDIDKAYYSELSVIQNAYVSRLEKAITETTNKKMKRRLHAQAKEAVDQKAWVTLLAPDLKEPEKPQAEGADSVIGNWDEISEGKIQRWIAHADGRMEIVGKDWKVKWRLDEDGTLVVDWKKVRPYIYTRDGDGWTGKATFGQPTSLKRGDW
jgi:serine/threonine protein kinase